MDPSYSPNSQGNTPVAGGFSGVGVPGTGTSGVSGVGVPVSGMPSGVPSGAPAMQQAPISSGTGDVVLSTSGRSKKPLIIGGILALVVAVVCGVVAVLMMNIPKKTAEEEYKDISTTLSKYYYEIRDVADYLKDGVDGRYELGGLFDLSALETLYNYRNVVGEFKDHLQALSYNSISDDDKTLAKKVIDEQSIEFFNIVDSSLSVIIGLMEDFENNNIDSFKTHLAEAGVISTDMDNMVAFFEIMSRIDSSNCASESISAECDLLFEEGDTFLANIGGGDDIMKRLYGNYLGEGKYETLTSFIDNVRSLRRAVANQLNEERSEEGDN